MRIYFDIHPVQAEVIRFLLFQTVARFSELNVQHLSSDDFSFHLRRLIALGLLEKREENYGLSTAGKEFANRFDDGLGLQQQAKLSVMLAPVRQSVDGPEYLIRQRMKQPYYGFFGFITGKIHQGETVLEAASRELAAETGLRGSLSYLGVQHKLDYTQDQSLLEDKYFFVMKASNLTGELQEVVEGGRNLWLSGRKVLELDQLFQGMDASLRLVEGGAESFTERTFNYEQADY